MNHHAAAQFLKLIDPSVRLDGLTPPEIEQEAAQAALWLAQEHADRTRPRRIDSAIGALLSQRQFAEYQHHLSTVEQLGKWQQYFGGESAHYLSPDRNPTAGVGVMCGNCVHFRLGVVGQSAGAAIDLGSCAIVAGDMQPEGVCRLVLIPSERVELVQDSKESIKRILKWQGLELGLTHEPGDERHGKPMKAFYGHVRGTYGQAEDGMAIDVYVGPDYLDSRKVYKIEQIKPESGEFDEYKYVIGVWTAAQARSLYLDHMPARFLCKVRSASIDEMRPRKQDADTREDGNILKWKGLSIGITHSPGDRRFALGVPMQAYYGRIHRSWGQGRDGKAIDAYVSKDFDPKGEFPIFRIMQRDPRTGEADELKYGFGYPTAEAFARDYIRHAGRDRFGYVEPVDGAELDQYRQDAIYHADNCGCEACQVRSRRRRKRKPAPAEDEEGTRSDAGDAEGEPDLPDFLLERFEDRLNTALDKWVEAIGRLFNSQGGLVEARKLLEESPSTALKRLDWREFEDALFQASMLADLGGRVEVLDESARSDSILSDALPRMDAPRPEWLRLPFWEAVEALRRRLVIPAAQYDEMEEGYHDWAFSIAGLTRGELLGDAKFLLGRAIEEGTSFEDFQRQWKRSIGRKGWQAGDRRLYTIYDTNIRGAHGTGRGKQMLDPSVRKARPYILWRWRDSPNPRLNHQALHNKAIASDHPFWQRCRIPGGFGCRCAGFAVSEQYCRANGIEILSSPPDPETIAEEGFRYPLQGLDPSERQRQQDRFFDRLDPSIQQAIQQEEK